MGLAFSGRRNGEEGDRGLFPEQGRSDEHGSLILVLCTPHTLGAAVTQHDSESLRSPSNFVNEDEAKM